ncbi:MAG: hypothetical protein U1E89_04655 [Burkholderiaceae bacterium]
MNSLYSDVDVLHSSMLPEEYCELRPRIYPGVPTLRWLIAHKKAMLFKLGALVIVAGRVRVVPGLMDQTMVEIANSEARRRAELDAATEQRTSTSAPE